MIIQDDSSIIALISQMRQKRDDLLMELEKVQKWLTTMESIISQGKAIVGENSEIIPEPPAQIVTNNEAPETKAGRILRLISDKPDAEKTHAEKCKQLLEESGGPLGLAQLDEQFLKRNWPIKSKAGKNNRRLIIYNTMKRREDWFVKLGDKMWGLKGRDDQEASNAAQPGLGV